MTGSIDRRQFLQLASSAALLPWPRVVRAQAKENNMRRPNIVVILADDMGFSDIGCFGGEIHTPHIDGLAAGGLRATQFYNVARCCPTRASLLTGLYPHQTGIGHMIDDYAKGARARLASPAYATHLNDHCMTIAEVLRTANYRTYMSGKWHVGHDDGQRPWHRGFDRSYALIPGACNYFKPGPNQIRLDDQPVTPQGDYYSTDAFSDYNVQFLQEHQTQHKEQPFFLYAAYNAPHWPLQARPQDIANYRGRYLKGWDVLSEERHQRQIAAGIVEARWENNPREPEVPPWSQLTAAQKDDFDWRMAIYAAQIECMDRGIGRILEQIKTMGQQDNTLVLLLSDNGGCAEIIDRKNTHAPLGTAASWASYGVGWADMSDTPFRLFKHYTHEGGIATPLLARWPTVIKPGLLAHDVGHCLDLMATFVEISGATYPKIFNGHQILPPEGVSLMPMLQGKSLQRPAPLFWEHEGNRAMRDGQWKIVARFQGGAWPRRWQLYDMAADRTERHNLAAQQPSRVQAMAVQWEAWAQRVGVVPWEKSKAAPVAG